MHLLQMRLKMDNLKSANKNLAFTAAACATTALLTYAICSIRSNNEEIDEQRERSTMVRYGGLGGVWGGCVRGTAFRIQ